MTPFILIALIFFVAGFTQGVTGFGSALVAMPLLLLFVDAQTAVPLCVLNGLFITGFLTLRLKTHMELRNILPLCIGCLPGIYIGVTFLKNADDAVIRGLLGLMLVGYALFSLLRGTTKTGPIHPFWAYVAGFGTGAIGGAFSAGGPPTIIYTTLTGWSKEVIKATLSGFFFLTGIGIATAHAVSGLTTSAVLYSLAVSAPLVLAGVWVGLNFSSRIPTEVYLRIVLVVLIGMGILMASSSFLY